MAENDIPIGAELKEFYGSPIKHTRVYSYRNKNYVAFTDNEKFESYLISNAPAKIVEKLEKERVMQAILNRKQKAYWDNK